MHGSLVPLCLGADNEEIEEVKSSPAKSAAKPTKKPILPDSVKAIAKVSLHSLTHWSTHSLHCSLAHPLSHSLALARSLTHSLSHSFHPSILHPSMYSFNEHMSFPEARYNQSCVSPCMRSLSAYCLVIPHLKQHNLHCNLHVCPSFHVHQADLQLSWGATCSSGPMHLQYASRHLCC